MQFMVPIIKTIDSEYKLRQLQHLLVFLDDDMSNTL